MAHSKRSRSSTESDGSVRVEADATRIAVMRAEISAFIGAPARWIETISYISRSKKRYCVNPTGLLESTEGIFVPHGHHTVIIEADSPAAVRRPPLPVAWLLLLGSAAAVLAIGVVATLLIVQPFSPSPASIRSSFWLALALATALTLLNLGIRALRWVFLLRRTETRIPIRDAVIGYLAGLSLLLAPLFVGEAAVRAFILRARGRVPLATTIVVNLWERVVDLIALAVLASAFGLLSGRVDAWTLWLIVGVAVSFSSGVRRLLLGTILWVLRPLTSWIGDMRPVSFYRLAAGRAWSAALGASVAAWALPGLAFWALVNAWDASLPVSEAQAAYARAAFAGGIVLAPGGVLVTGNRLLRELAGVGLQPAEAVLTVLAIRLATVGVATALGAVFVAVHWRSRSSAEEGHFDSIADAYDVQIPEKRREALLLKKTILMQDVIRERRAGPLGLDVGCGQGWYVVRMRELGFDVTGIDSSAAQIRFADRHLGSPGVMRFGSALMIPAPDGTYDFAYVINVLHHLTSVDEQRAAFVEMLRVLKPGGLLFVHEINTRNLLFRFYMGYIFPSLNCIDEGIERWLLPNELGRYTDAPVLETHYFTFLPDFVPQGLARFFGPFERLLERSRFGVYSAHYMAVIQKPGR